MDQIYLGILGIGIGLVVIGAGLSIGKIGTAAMEAMARQPEIAGQVMKAMLIIAGFIEAVALFAIVVAFMAM